MVSDARNIKMNGKPQLTVEEKIVNRCNLDKAAVLTLEKEPQSYGGVI